jgi:hypothetical protein
LSKDSTSQIFSAGSIESIRSGKRKNAERGEKFQSKRRFFDLKIDQKPVIFEAKTVFFASFSERFCLAQLPA